MNEIITELNRFAKIITNRVETMNLGQGGAGQYSETVDRINKDTAEVLGIITLILSKIDKLKGGNKC